MSAKRKHGGKRAQAGRTPEPNPRKHRLVILLTRDERERLEQKANLLKTSLSAAARALIFRGV